MLIPALQYHFPERRERMALPDAVSEEFREGNVESFVMGLDEFLVPEQKLGDIDAVGSSEEFSQSLEVFRSRFQIWNFR